MEDLRIVPETVATDLSAGLQQFTRFLVGAPQVVEQLSGLNGELMQFMAAQLTRNLDMMRAMWQCRGPAEFIELQLKWAHETFEDYMAEANRLMKRNGGPGGYLGVQSDKDVSKPAATKAGARQAT